MHVFKPSMTLRAEHKNNEHKYIHTTTSEKKHHGINEQIKLVHIKMIISFSFCIASHRVACYIVGLESCIVEQDEFGLKFPFKIFGWHLQCTNIYYRYYSYQY